MIPGNNTENLRLVLIADKTTPSLPRSMVQRKHPVDVGIIFDFLYLYN